MMDGCELSELHDKDSEEKEETLHSGDFNAALEQLLGKTFGSYDEALRGLEVFKFSGYSPLAKHSDVVAKTHGQKTSVFRCEVGRDCSFRLLLRHPQEEQEMFRFTLGQKGIEKHTGHELKRPGRTTKVVLDILEQTKAATAARDGSEGSELQKKSINAVNALFGGKEAVNEETYNYWRRKLLREKLSKRDGDRATGFDVIIRDGEDLVEVDPKACDPNLLAVLGLLKELQRNHPDTYINVCFDKVLSYVFFSLPQQRKNGSLYGDIRLFDDKHGVSENGYHLAVCTVQGNQKLEVAAVGLFASSNGDNWARFVKDCQNAFETTQNKPVRPWHLSLADADGSIHSAVNAADPLVEMWTCWRHFNTRVTEKHRKWAGQWSKLHTVMYGLLTAESERKVKELVRSFLMDLCFLICFS